MIIFIGYRIIDGSNLIFKSQLNTTNNQMSINNFNKYISEDIHNSISVEGPIFSKNKLDGSEYTLDNIDKNDEVNYEYKITTNKNKELVYTVSIKSGKYSIYRTDYNGVSLNFIDNDKLVEDSDNIKVPLVIEASSSNELLYIVNLQSMGEKDNQYSFQVASRHQSGSISGDNQGETESPGGSGSAGGNQGSTEDPDDSVSTISKKNLVFEYKKLYKIDYSENYNWQHKVILNMEQIKSDSAEKPNTSVFLDEFAIIRNGENISTHISSYWSPKVETTNSKVKDIKGFKLKFEDGIKMKNISFMNKYYGDLTESNKEYIFSNYSVQSPDYMILLSGNVEIEESSKMGDTYTIEIEFIY